MLSAMLALSGIRLTRPIGSGRYSVLACYSYMKYVLSFL